MLMSKFPHKNLRAETQVAYMRLCRALVPHCPLEERFLAVAVERVSEIDVETRTRTVSLTQLKAGLMTRELLLLLREQMGVAQSTCIELVLSLFEKAILPANATHYVQYIPVFLSCLSSHFTEKFVTLLLLKAFNLFHKEHFSTRQHSLIYLTSFLENFAQPTLLLKSLRLYLRYLKRSDDFAAAATVGLARVFGSKCDIIHAHDAPLY